MQLYLWQVEEPRKGWSTLNLSAAQHVVAEHGYRWAWQQRCSLYEVEVYSPGQEHPRHTWQFATAEEARQWYEHLPMGSIQTMPEAPPDLAARLSQSEVLTGRKFNRHLGDKKILPTDWHLEKVPSLKQLQTSVPSFGTAAKDLTNLDLPLETPVLTVAELLGDIGYPRNEVAAQLGITPTTLHRRERNPEMWTVADLQRVAHLTEWPLPSLAALIEQEVAR